MNNTKPEPSQYFGFSPYEYGDFVIGLEKIRNMGLELAQLWKQHWEETEVLYLAEKLHPDFKAFIDYESQGRFVVFTARLVGTMQMVGNLMYFIGPNTHIKGTVIAKEDAFFLLPDYRTGRLAVELLHYAEDCLKKLGVTYVGMSDKSPTGGKSLDKFMRRNGYKPIAVQYLKKLEDQP